jgi:hypothetical protein
VIDSDGGGDISVLGFRVTTKMRVALYGIRNEVSPNSSYKRCCCNKPMGRYVLLWISFHVYEIFSFC